MPHHPLVEDRAGGVQPSSGGVPRAEAARMNATILWVIAAIVVIVVIVGIVQLLQGRIILGIVLIVVGLLVVPGAYSIFNSRRRV